MVEAPAAAEAGIANFDSTLLLPRRAAWLTERAARIMEDANSIFIAAEIGLRKEMCFALIFVLFFVSFILCAH